MAGHLRTARVVHTTTLLQSGHLLVVGGQDQTGNALGSAELGLYTPSFVTPTYTPTHTARPTHTSTSTSAPTSTPTSRPTKTYTPSRTPTRTKTPTRAPTLGLVTIENEDYRIQYDGWRGVKDTRANGGSYRVSLTAGDTISYTFTGTAVKWVTKKGPDEGIAQVAIDGVSKPEVDLYSATPVWKLTRTYSGLKSAKHTIVLRVSGNKNASATNTNVVFDAFVVSLTTTQDKSYKIQYNDWFGKAATGPSGGSYRSNGSAGAVAKLTFSGSSIQWITAKGPGYGQATLWINGVQVGGTVDLYSSTAQWKVAMPFNGLNAGQHTIEIRPLGTKSAASTGTNVIVDAFKGPINASAGMIEAIGDQVGNPAASPEPASADGQGDSSWWFWMLPIGIDTLVIVRRRS
jgi:hypothetical protein